MTDTTRPEPTARSNAHRWTLAVPAALSVVLVLIISASVALAGVDRRGPSAVTRIEHGAAQTVLHISVSPAVKRGPDGKLHDAFSQTTFHVHHGQAITLVIHNTDDVPHAIVSSAAGVDIVAKPGTHRFTLLVKKRGVFMWHCSQPCDPYSMAHMGFMMGTIVAS